MFAQVSLISLVEDGCAALLLASNPPKKMRKLSLLCSKCPVEFPFQDLAHNFSVHGSPHFRHDHTHERTERCFTFFSDEVRAVRQ